MYSDFPSFHVYVLFFFEKIKYKNADEEMLYCTHENAKKRKKMEKVQEIRRVMYSFELLLLVVA